ncbi:uncharacterized protein LOC131319859 isoform X2 [Rhododendron vialii]|uniref:uncharacterized protein LOC131319859 isoform X2 n=1 Tax=Rhododendron vialii TaxID=182163 RepID=UPI00265D8795|nr:uncharacterized protein LOC131319859 isoform X2 [Rhododendron vialii]
MASRFQAAALVASPSHPNAVAWSDENLVAVASGHIVTILNPATPFGPRGLITISPSKPFPIGVVERKDLLSGCLLPTCLSRDPRPCVRSISWSPVGFAPNSGCLLAVCTTEGRVKLYRMPYCEFSAEWVEADDISEMLYSYFASINFVESDDSNSEISNEQANQLSLEVVEIKSGNMKANNLNQIVCVPNSRAKPLKKKEERPCLPQITANQYSFRSTILSSLVVAWSPVVQLASEMEPVSAKYSSNRCSILAVGGKSGKVSFWRFLEPSCFSVMSNRDSTSASLVGVLQVHSAWITAICWASYSSGASDPQLLLATGSSDGSVKIWIGYGGALLKSSDVNNAPFSLLKEVMTVDFVPVSVVSLIVPIQSANKMHLAVGKGSGSFDVWICDISSTTGKFDKLGSYGAHDHIITGLAWAFDGCCLYSCSQDNSVYNWTLCDSRLCEVPFPSNIPFVKSSGDVPNVFDSCFGLATSPGNLVIAVARSFDADLLNPMYQARSQKAAIEFFWIGGQQWDVLSNRDPDFDVEAISGFPEKELVYWTHSILLSLKQYENVEKPLVVWDIITALLAFKQSAPKYVEHVLAKWLMSCVGIQLGLPIAKTLSEVSRLLSNIGSRQLHLLNIVNRRVVLAELKADNINCGQTNLGPIGAEEDVALWMELLLGCENELRERLVAFSFSAISSSISTSSSNGDWQPVGLAQMGQWVAHNGDNVRDHLKLLVAGFRKLNNRYAAEEQCSYCSASVPFESTEFAFCRAASSSGGVGQSHKLLRCAASMQVCPATPSWFCICCQRWVSKLAPQALFRMATCPFDFEFSTVSSRPEVISKPLCPFCGILLQRLQPEFLLSKSPV